MRLEAALKSRSRAQLARSGNAERPRSTNRSSCRCAIAPSGRGRKPTGEAPQLKERRSSRCSWPYPARESARKSADGSSALTSPSLPWSAWAPTAIPSSASALECARVCTADSSHAGAAGTQCAKEATSASASPDRSDRVRRLLSLGWTTERASWPCCRIRAAGSKSERKLAQLAIGESASARSLLSVTAAVAGERPLPIAERLRGGLTSKSAQWRIREPVARTEACTTERERRGDALPGVETIASAANGPASGGTSTSAQPPNHSCSGESANTSANSPAELRQCACEMDVDPRRSIRASRTASGRILIRVS
mmetsp:Transcript_35551/g.105410  ORF Transcript_35551/g.105410 Transcript_35551/m.105410 type:complete len:312 (-) Transcript_35551:372-1307(-)